MFILQSLRVFNFILIALSVITTTFAAQTFAKPLVKQNQSIKINNVIADFVEYNELTNMIYAKGNINIVAHGHRVSADSMLYDVDKDLLWLEGNVKIKNGTHVVVAEKVMLQDKLKSGVISEFIMLFNNDTLLIAKLANRINENKAHLVAAEFTPCQVTCNKNPIWQISAKDTYVDLESNKITYKNVFFQVYGVPIFYLPYFAHHMPSAPASSGVLVPNMKDEGVGLPLYLRVKPNMDFTLTPRIFQKYTIFALEGRYSMNRTNHVTFEGNYGAVPYFLEKGGVQIKNKKIPSYYYSTNGNFYTKNYNYGFAVARTSDKAYLKNYNNNYSPYLASKIFINKIWEGNYLQTEGMLFQGLGSDDSKCTDPVIFPKINTKNVINISNNNVIIVESDTLMYKERRGKQLTRMSLQLSLLHTMFTPYGQIVNLMLKDRGDVYLVSDDYSGKIEKKRTLLRHIPEFQVLLRYPWSGVVGNAALLVEPVVSYTVGRKIVDKDARFIVIDPDKYELSVTSMFHSNHYGGVDCHNFGDRLSYGLTTMVSQDSSYLTLFLGQAKNYHAGKFSHGVENIGKISVTMSQCFSIFYSFRKGKRFESMRDEVGCTLKSEKMNLSTSFIRLLDLKKYYNAHNTMSPNNMVQQFYGDISYNLTENLSVGFGVRVDMSGVKPRLFSRTIQVTYIKDCVKIAARVHSDFLADKGRGIKKTKSSPTVIIGLKVLNM